MIEAASKFADLVAARRPAVDHFHNVYRPILALGLVDTGPVDR